MVDGCGFGGVQGYGAGYPSFGYGGYPGYGYAGYGRGFGGFGIILVLFILLAIILLPTFNSNCCC